MGGWNRGAHFLLLAVVLAYTCSSDVIFFFSFGFKFLCFGITGHIAVDN